MSLAEPASGESRRQFEQEVFPAELDYIENRRRSVGGVEDSSADPGETETADELVGLALSGGGIRSASFSLGFLQALDVAGLFRRVDYLSTVSGGGFIGSSISALMASAFYREKLKREGSGSDDAGGDPPPASFPFPLTRREEESPALSHLRNNSNYMTPGGLGDVFRLVAVLLRGIILNSLSLFPFLLLVCLVVLLGYGQQLSDRATFDDQVKRIDGLLGRYYGDRLETERELDPLLATLEAEALLRVAEGKTRGDVIVGLRPALSLQALSPGTGPAGDLITGNGTAGSPYRLTPEASREDLARTLLVGDVLQRNEVIEEVDLLARVLEQDGYRHPGRPAGDGEPAAASPGGEAARAALVRAARQRSLIRPGTDPQALDALLERHWKPHLKPVLQALYNAEYLDEATVRDLVLAEADRRRRESRRPPSGRLADAYRPFYAYGWYEDRVGQPFSASWYASHPWPKARVGFELTRLTRAFWRDECVREETGELNPDCFRGRHCGPPAAPPGPLRQQDRPREAIAGTTSDDVRRLLEFEGVIDRGAALVPLEGETLLHAVEVLYFGEYLCEPWVLARLYRPAGRSAEEALAISSERLVLGLLSQGVTREDLFDRLVLAENTVTADVTDLLRYEGLWALVERWPAEGPPSDPASARDLARDLAPVLSAIRPLLDEGWVDRQLYVYSYGWHRRLVGRAYPGDWCGGAAASLAGAGGCLETRDDAWAELSRTLGDPSRWDPKRLQLPFTWVAVRLALGWVLLSPLLLIAARWVYRRRQGEVAARSNPLEVLEASDKALDWRDLYERSFGILLAVIVGVALVELLPYAVHHFHYLSLRGQSTGTLALGAVSLLVSALAGPALALFRRFGRVLALAALAVAGPVFLLTAFVFTMEYAVYKTPPWVDALLAGVGDRMTLGLFEGHLALWTREGGRWLLDPAAAGLLFAITAAASIGLALLIDINATSLHGLYRDRLSRAFMVGLDTEGDIEPEDDLALHRICPDGSGAPYHLINVALNLQGSGDRSLRGRNSDFLFFSRDHVGGPRTGFCRTGDMAWVFPQAHLGSAMAVSAAAVSPNMGQFKTGPLAVLMSLLNTRLALWMPHPGVVREWFHRRRHEPEAAEDGRTSPFASRLRESWRRFRLRAPATLLLRELAGAIHDRGPVVNVSDGGHIENTGALELLRRRCREIIIVDGEADPEMAFGGLARLQRIARIDMGIEIEIDLGPLRPDENGLSRSRSQVGTIHYPARQGGEGRELAERTGRLLYVKLAVTGTEGETVAEYRARNREFPHQSTGDQSFDEGQLEAYRRLGYLAGRDVFGARAGGGGEVDAGGKRGSA